MRKIVHGLVDRELLKLCLFRCQGLGCSFVGNVGGDPQLVPERCRVVIDWHEVRRALALTDVTVLLVVPDTNHDADKPKPHSHVASQRAERRFRRIFVNVENSVLDVVRPGDLIHPQLRLRAFEFLPHRRKDDIIFPVGLCRLDDLSQGRSRQKKSDDDREQHDAGAGHDLHCFAPEPFVESAPSSVGAGRVGGRLSEWARFCPWISENSIAGPAAATGTCPDSAPQTPLNTSVVSPVTTMRFMAESGVPTISMPRTSSSGRPSAYTRHTSTGRT